MESRVAPPVLLHGGRYEDCRLTYTTKPRRYTPDFDLPNGIALEVKGYFPACDRTKLLDVQRAFPDLDLRLILATPDAYLTKAKSETQAGWCASHGFPFAKDVVPPSWFREPMNAKSKAILDANRRAPR